MPRCILIHAQCRKLVRTNGSLLGFLQAADCQGSCQDPDIPDGFTFYYTNVAQGYKMVGNAVPVRLAFNIANKISNDLAFLGSPELRTSIGSVEK